MSCDAFLPRVYISDLTPPTWYVTPMLSMGGGGINTLPTPVGVGHRRTESTNTGCNQWLSLAKIALKVPLASRNRSLVASTAGVGRV
jgi:hypothetical protein